MKILFVTPDFYPNSTGFANAALNLINAIKIHSSSANELYVFTDKPLGENRELEKINVIRYKNSKFNNRFTYAFNERKKYNFLKNYIDSKNIDIIFFETNTFPFLQNLILNRYKEKVFVRIHSTADTEVVVFGKHKSFFERLQIRSINSFMLNVNNIVSTSSFYLDFIKKYYLQENVYDIWDNKTYSIIPNTAGDEIAQANCVMDNTFITMGKMSKNGLTQKGITDLLRAVYCLKKSKCLPNDFKLIIIGDGEMRRYVTEYIEKLKISSYIQLIQSASHEEVFKYISNSKAVILLSRYEGQSMFVTESLALGKPLIITSNNGMQDMVDDGINGLLVKTGDYKGTAEAIKTVVEMDFQKLHKMGINSKIKYDNNYSAKSVCEEFFDTINMV